MKNTRKILNANEKCANTKRIMRGDFAEAGGTTHRWTRSQRGLRADIGECVRQAGGLQAVGEQRGCTHKWGLENGLTRMAEIPESRMDGLAQGIEHEGVMNGEKTNHARRSVGGEAE